MPFMPLKTYISVTESFASFGYYGHAHVCKKMFLMRKTPSGDGGSGFRTA